MQIALTGASGFIGSAIAARLAADGHAVTALVRETSRRDHIEDHVDRFVVGDHADPEAWTELLEGADAVVHDSANWALLKSGERSAHYRNNLLASLEFLDRSAPRPFVFLSTIAVHHDMRPRWEGRIDEDHPTRPGNLYGAYKAAVEAHLWAARHAENRTVCALRPCAVYGMDPDPERTIGWPIIGKLRSEGRYDRPGGGKFVHVDDVVDAVMGALAGKDPDAVVVDLVDCYARWADWATIAAELMGIDAEIDRSSPPQPKNMFTCEPARRLGARLDRGHEGIREHLRDVIAAVDAAG